MAASGNANLKASLTPWFAMLNAWTPLACKLRLTVMSEITNRPKYAIPSNNTNRVPYFTIITITKTKCIKNSREINLEFASSIDRKGIWFYSPLRKVNWYPLATAQDQV